MTTHGFVFRGRRSGNISDTMLQTTLVNKCGRTLDLKEGSAGVYRFVKQLSNGERFVVNIDLNSTHRDYLIEIQPDSGPPRKVFLTSDDCIDNQVVTVVVTVSLDPNNGTTSVYEFVGVPRGYGFVGVPRGESRPMEEESSESWFRKLFSKLFSKR